MKFSYFISIIYKYSYQGLLLLLATEFIGAPIPGEPLMTFVGYRTASSNLSIYKAIAFATTGTFLGSMIAYFIGKKVGRQLFEKYSKYIHVNEEKVLKIETWMNKKYHYIGIILISRYIPGVRHIVPYLSGICDLRIRNYAFWNFISSIVWCCSFIMAGRMLGEKWHILEGLFREYIIEILIFILIVFILYYVIGKLILAKKKK